MTKSVIRCGRAQSAPERSSHRSQLLATVFTVLLPFIAPGVCSGSWIRFLGDPANSQPGIPLILGHFAEGDHSLSAGVYYRYVEGRDPVAIRGKRRADGVFQPLVKYEVALEDKAKWKEMPASAVQPVSETIMVSPRAPMVRMWINMEPFRKCVGVYRYGRIVLENGDSAIFEIDDLLPTRGGAADGGNFKDEVFASDDSDPDKGVLQPKNGAEAELYCITSLAGRLIGDFTVFNRTPKAIKLLGTRTIDGDFWPKAILQISGPDREWKTIGEPQSSGGAATLQIPSGKAEKVRVVLTSLKEFIGKTKYGRVLLPDVEGEAFSLDILKQKG